MKERKIRNGEIKVKMDREMEPIEINNEQRKKYKLRDGVIKENKWMRNNMEKAKRERRKEKK